MISKNQVKHLASLHLKKNRDKERLFFVEGIKMVHELLKSSYKVHSIYASDEWLMENEKALSKKPVESHTVSEAVLSKISTLTTPQQVLALVSMADHKIELNDFKGKLTLILDDIKDPGNLGTIVRIADWFGIENIICSSTTVDIYNPKVVQATMGSVFRVKVFYDDLAGFLKENKSALKLPVYGATMTGASIYDARLSNEGFIVLGSESAGIGEELKPYVTNTLSIPSFASHVDHAESLNVAVATAIVCSEFMRRGETKKKNSI